MKVIAARNVNEAYFRGMRLFWMYGYPILPSRAGDVLECPDPVTTVYDQPRERVLFDASRDCNPFFHLFESLWMLAGRQDVEFLGQFSKQAATLIEGGSSYGYRWMHYFGFDQLQSLIELLKKDHTTRRAVLAMWNPPDDLGSALKDIPCNTTVKFQIRDGRLDMQVFCRSNDMIWGAYGANAVHFSFLQEYMAAMIGVQMGRYWQISTNYHVYVAEFQKKSKDFFFTSYDDCPYERNEVAPVNLVDNPKTFNDDLTYLLEEGPDNFLPRTADYSPFLLRTVLPMWRAWRAYKGGERYDLDVHLKSILAPDWRRACTEWINRRLAKEIT